MLVNDAYPPKKNRFSNLASTDLYMRHFIKNTDLTTAIAYEVGEVRRMVWYLDSLQRDIERIANTDAPPWCSYVLSGVTRYPMSREARFLWHSIRSFEHTLWQLCEGRRMNPWLRLGLHLARKWEPRLRCFMVHENLDLSLEYPRRIWSHIIYVIRRVCRSRRFRDLLKKDGRTANDRYISCCKYLLKVLSVCARPLVFRYDLYFEGDAKEISESEEANRAYDKHIRRLRDGSIVGDVLAYVAVREDGLDRRIHYHVMVWVDGNDHRNAYGLAEQCGRDWVDHCVGSPALASYKNCWERRAEYQHCCLGLMHYSDEDMLMGLRDALRYMCKLSEQPHVYVKKGMGKDLRKGQPPRLEVDRKKRGAPRKHGNDIALARQILLGTKA